MDVSYTKQAAFGHLGDIDSAHPFVMSDGQPNPVTDELSWQIQVRMKEIKRDIEFALIQGAFNEPANNRKIPHPRRFGRTSRLASRCIDFLLSN